MQLVGRLTRVERCIILTTNFMLEPLEPQSDPQSTTLPFSRDPDYVHRGPLLERIGEKLSRSGRAALVGVGGVGYGACIGSTAQLES